MSEIIKQKTIEETIKTRNLIIEKLKQMKKLEKEMEYLAKSVNIIYFAPERIAETVRYYNDKLDYEIAIKEIDKKFWIAILEKIKLSSAMTENAKNQLYNKLDREPPKFTENEVNKVINNLKNIYGNNAMQTIREVYNNLIGHYYHGSNQNVKKYDNLKEVKSTFRISGNIYWSCWGDWDLRTYYGHGFNYEDFYTACKILDGQPQSDYANKFETIARKHLKDEKKDIIETKYFTVKPYKNGNQLVKWTKYGEKIRELLNRYGSSGKLPDTMGKRYKPEHF